MVYVEHSKLVRVDIEVRRSTSGWSRLLCIRRFGGARSGFYLVAITFLNPHSRAAFCYIISALAISIIARHFLFLDHFATF